MNDNGDTQASRIVITFNDAESAHFSLDLTALSPAQILLAAEILRMEGEAHYAQMRLMQEQNARENALQVARSFPAMRTVD